MKTCCTFLLLFIGFTAFAQKSDSTHMHYRFIRGGFIEHSTTLKTNKQIKNGVAKVMKGHKVVATGMYENNNRVGRWNFYRSKDSLDQIYNYTTKKVEYNAPDSLIFFEIDSLKAGDKVVPPMKIGGNYYGLFFLIQNFKIPKESNAYPGIHKVYLIFHLDVNGKLVKYDTEILLPVLKKTTTMDLSKLKEEDFDFSPAYLNGKSVASRYVYESTLTVN
ncbi:hypothetical protein [Pedobacter agri]|uniref:hypothetical protein n=1 Tax=Pedobacter agri TaxID=454586 RepID=UPI00293102A2|nr:hypothetical protein [Pedobacter agri]